MTAGPRDIESGRGDGSYMGFVGVATGYILDPEGVSTLG